jgi:ABC-type Mn2+/Zn2+ transport system permease subunit
VLLAMVAGTAVVSVDVAGVILTVAVLVTPAATASLWRTTLGRTMLLAGLVATLAGAVGLYAAYYVKVAPAAAIVLALGACFGLSTVLAPRGPLAKYAGRLKAGFGRA